MRVAVGDLAADRVVYDDARRIGGPLQHAPADLLEQREALGRLRKQADRAREVDALQIVRGLDDDGVAVHLTGQPYDFGMSPLAEDDDLPPAGLHLLMGAFDELLQPGDHRTGSVDQADAVLACEIVGRGRFAVSPDQHRAAAHAAQFVVRNRFEAQLLEPLYFHAVVHDVAERADPPQLRKRLLGFRDRLDHAEAESRFFVYFDVHVA